MSPTRVSFLALIAHVDVADALKIASWIASVARTVIAARSSAAQKTDYSPKLSPEYIVLPTTSCLSFPSQ